MDIKEAVQEAFQALDPLYGGGPNRESIASLAGSILVSQAIEKLAEAMSYKGPTPDPHGC